MKTHVNKSQTSNDHTFRVSLFSILVIGSVLIFTIAEIYGQTTYYNDTPVFGEYLNLDTDYNEAVRIATKRSDNFRDDTSLKYISPLEACCSINVKQELEIEKIKESLIPDHMVVYWNVLAEFNAIEEPELVNKEVSLPFAYPVLESNSVRYPHTQDDTFNYLKEMYEQKNREVFNELETDRKLKNYLEVEIEHDMGLEDWMLDERVFSTNQVIVEEIEAPLQLEEWMTAKSVWK